MFLRVYFTGITLLYNSVIPVITEIHQESVLKALDITAVTCVGIDAMFDFKPDYSIWEEYTRIAIATSNILTAILSGNNSTLNSFTNEEMFYNIAQGNVMGGQPAVCGSTLAFEPGVYSSHRSFGQYVYYRNGTVTFQDFALMYNYYGPDSEWYYSLKTKDWQNIKMVKIRPAHTRLPDEENTSYLITRQDGNWGKPSFDCGGTGIWLVSFTSPILGKDQNGSPVFRGVVTIDIDLSNSDINQCDSITDETDDAFFNVFRGTHKCQPSTQCIFLPRFGFRRGGYICTCKKGFYFPFEMGSSHSFKGEDIEKSSDPSQYECLPCSEGCNDCLNDKTCLKSENIETQTSNTCVTNVNLYCIIMMAVLVLFL